MNRIRRWIGGLLGTEAEAERREADRRAGTDRRTGADRRNRPGAIPGEVDRRSGAERRSGRDRRDG